MAMSVRRRRVEDLLFDGETVRETVGLEAGQVVVTSHRVLAFTPEGTGANFQQADLPNVESVVAGARSDGRTLELGLKTGAVGVVLLGTGLLVDFGRIVGDVDLGNEAAAGRIGVGGILGAVRSFLGFVRNLDQYMQLVGALALLLALALAGVYWYLRERVVVVEVAGGDDIHVPRTAGDTEAMDRLERVIAPGPTDWQVQDPQDGASAEP
jgi:hypothetical protein